MIDLNETKRIKAKNLRYKKAIVKDINLDTIRDDLYEMYEKCSDVYYMDYDDNNMLIDAIDGNEEEAFEFQTMFSDLCRECEQMQEDLDNYNYNIPAFFDDFFVAVEAGEYGGGLLGYDSYEKDYYGLDLPYSWAEGESKKRLMRFTKEEIIKGAKMCFRVVQQYIGLRYRYESLEAAMNILTDKNMGYLQVIKHIEEAYENANKDNFYLGAKTTKNFNKLVETMPEEIWLM